MGYHLTILRTSDGEASPIEGAEFAAAVRRLPELKWDEVGECAEYFRGTELRAALRLQDGKIWTKVAEPDVIEVMIRLASLLGARVRGDEFETYRTPDDTYFHPDDRAEQEQAETEGERVVRESRRRGRIMHLCIFGSFVGFALIVAYCSRR